MKGHQRVRAIDVAKEAGVSTATVSYVLNNTAGQTISEATSLRVRNAAKKLGYVSNPAAQALARGSSNLVIVEMSDFPAREIAMYVGNQLASILENLGYQALTTWWPGGRSRPENTSRLTSLVRATNPLAIFSTFPLDPELKSSLTLAGQQSYASVVANLEDARPMIQLPARAQINYLHEQGHTHIFLVAPHDPTLKPILALRREAVQIAAAEKEMNCVALPAFTDVPHLKALLSEAMSAHPQVTAIAAYNDDTALPVLFALHMLGVEVPERMAVIGIDNLAIAEAVYPKLTSVQIEVDFESLDSEALRTVVTKGGVLESTDTYVRSLRFEVKVRASA